MAEDERDQGAWIGGLLDAAARGYEPDGERLRDLVSSRIAEQDGDRPRSARRARPARTRLNRTFSAGAGIAAVAAAVVIAVGVTTMLAVTSSSPTATGSPRAADGGPGPGAPTHTSTAAIPAPSNAPGSGGTAATPSQPAHSYVATERVDPQSNPNWAQLDVVVTAKQPLTALEITIRVAGCDGLAMPKSFDDGPYGVFASSSTSSADGSISYVFSLVAGHTFAPGTVEFAAQFSHAATGWRQDADTYRISVQTAAAPGAAVTDGAY